MLDKKDNIILDILRENADLSTYKISKKTHIPQTTVLNRIRKMREHGIIIKYTVKVNLKRLGLDTKAIIFVKTDKNNELKEKGKIGEMENTIVKYPQVVNVKRLMGKYDIMIECACANIDELNNFLVNKIRSNPAIADTETLVILQEWEN